MMWKVTEANKYTNVWSQAPAYAYSRTRLASGFQADPNSDDEIWREDYYR